MMRKTLVDVPHQRGWPFRLSMLEKCKHGLVHFAGRGDANGITKFQMVKLDEKEEINIIKFEYSILKITPRKGGKPFHLGAMAKSMKSLQRM